MKKAKDVQVKKDIVWIETITQSLVEPIQMVFFGYQQNNTEYTLFIKHYRGKIILLIVYVMT